MTEQTQRDIGRLESKVMALESDIAEVKSDVKEVLAIINKTRGGWTVMVAVSAIGGAVGAFAMKVLPFFTGLPK